MLRLTFVYSSYPGCVHWNHWSIDQHHINSVILFIYFHSSWILLLLFILLLWLSLIWSKQVPICLDAVPYVFYSREDDDAMVNRRYMGHFTDFIICIYILYFKVLLEDGHLCEATPRDILHVNCYTYILWMLYMSWNKFWFDFIWFSVPT